MAKAFLLGKFRPIISGSCRYLTSPTTSLTAVTAAIRRAIEDDRYPHAPRLDPLGARRWESSRRPGANPAPDGPAAKVDKRARGEIAGKGLIS